MVIKQENILNFIYMRKMKSKLSWDAVFYSHALAKFQKSENTLCWPKSRERGILIYCWWEWKMVQLLWRTSWDHHSKLWIHFLLTQKSLFREKLLTAISECDNINECSIILMAKDWIWLKKIHQLGFSLINYGAETPTLQTWKLLVH